MIQTMLPRSIPAKQSVSAKAILDFVHALEREEIEVHSFILLRHGHVIAEGTWSPYHSEDPHILNSLSKSFTSTAIGFAVMEGKLSVDDTVISFFPEYVTEDIAKNMAHLKVRHLLSMATGHKEDTTSFITEEEDWVKAFLNLPIDYEPGTHFLYNTGATYMLSAILTKVTGIKLLDYLEPRLFEPLGMSDITTTTCPKGIHFGGAGMKVKIEDIAKFGLLYLQKGKWEGKQILSEQWIEEATKKQISNGEGDNDWAQGYGYQFWRCRHDAYRGDGAFGQYCVVLPEQDAVLAVTSGVMEMSMILDIAWKHLLPGLAKNIEVDENYEKELASKLATLAYEPPNAHGISSHRLKWSEKRFEAQTNSADITAFSFNFADEHDQLTIWDGAGEHHIKIGHGKWVESTSRLVGKRVKVAVSGTWKSRYQYELTVRLLGTPFCDTWTCDFINQAVRITVSRNIWFAPRLSDLAQLPDLVGAINNG